MSRSRESHNDSCPLKGRRAPEIASGSFKRFFDELTELIAGDFIHHHCGHIEDRHRAMLASDFERGKTFIRLQLEIKMSSWDRLPLKLLGIGHY
eukprot:10974791-Alexandrium_andersonii.AAC.1